ncbi:hypothetical protein Heshes_14140 [Alicyclobacillus hesperidum]|uniref:Uncharacterized protein n=1 Tax=Alicyclobacillus hesperidum TaxID=89784 RepID=A0AA37X305_9BACL|nr:hypothetical protein Heshes_14140 [Alicyclobacillus hesperidum]
MLHPGLAKEGPYRARATHQEEQECGGSGNELRDDVAKRGTIHGHTPLY